MTNDKDPHVRAGVLKYMFLNMESSALVDWFKMAFIHRPGNPRKLRLEVAQYWQISELSL